MVQPEGQIHRCYTWFGADACANRGRLATGPVMKHWLTAAEARQVLGVPKSTWQTWLATGRGPETRRLPNGQLRIREDWLEDWLEQLPAA